MSRKTNLSRLKLRSPIFAVIISIALLASCATAPTSSTGSYETNPTAQKEREIGEKQFALRNYASSLIHLLSAMKLDPSDPVTHYDLAIVYRAKDLPEKAEYHLKEAIRLKPEYPEALNALGSLYLEMKEYEKAIPVLEKAATDIYYKTPHYAYYNLGRVYQKLKRYDLAVLNFKRAVQIAPRFGRAYFSLGEISELEGNMEAAKLYYERSLLYDAKNPQAYYNLGRIHLAKGEYKDAYMAFQKVVVLAPATELSESAKKYLGRLRGYKNIPMY